MNKSLVSTGVAVLALWIISKWLGIWVSLGIVLIGVLIIMWNRRASILTQFAAQAYYIKGDTKKGEKLYKMAYKTGMMTANCKLAYSSFCLRENQFDKGKRLLNEVINSNRSSEDDRIEARHNMAVLVWREGDLDTAIEIIEEVHKERPATNTYGTVGVLYLEKAKRDGGYADILDFMLEAYDYNDADKTIADNLGETYLHMEEYEKAKEVYAKLLEHELITPMPYYNYGIVLKNTGDIEGAKESFEKALNCRFTSVITVTREMVQAELDSLQ